MYCDGNGNTFNVRRLSSPEGCGCEDTLDADFC